MNHWAVQPNAFAAGGDLRSSVSVIERDQTVVVCPKPRRIGLRNHPTRSLRCYFSHQVELCESKAETDILDIILTKAKEVRRLADNMVQFGKEGLLDAARRATGFVRGDDVIHKLFTELVDTQECSALGYELVNSSRSNKSLNESSG